MINLREFLKELEEQTPSHSGKHSFTYARTGSKKLGWEDRLALNVRLSNGDTQVIYLDPNDLDLNQSVLITRILSALPKADGRGKPKGGEYERQIGYKLSLWLSKGQRKDLICRTVGSGAQFTSANLRNQTAGIPGDLRSQDPLADRFQQLYVVECKFRRDLEFLKFLRADGELYKAYLKVRGEANQLKKRWMLICRQNRNPDILITTPPGFFIGTAHSLLGGDALMYQLDDFLQKVTPELLLGDSEQTTKSSDESLQQGRESSDGK